MAAQCYTCSKTFSANGLARHNKSKHRGFTFKCDRDECANVFRYLNQLQEHQRIVHAPGAPADQDPGAVPVPIAVPGAHPDPGAVPAVPVQILFLGLLALYLVLILIMTLVVNAGVEDAGV